MFPILKPEDYPIKKTPAVDFIPPKRHDGKNSYVWFSQIDPLTGRMKRKKYMLDRYKKGKERDMMASRIMYNIYNKVMHGWNVWAPTDTDRCDTATRDVIAQYRKYIAGSCKKDVLKKKTYYDYTSRLRILEEYINESVAPASMCFQLDQGFWTDFFDYLLLDRDLSAKSRNNYRTWASSFCTWLVEKRYLEDNPIRKIRQLPENDKYRQPLTPDDLRKLSHYLQEHDRPFLLAVMMEYFTAIRPTELSFIKLGDINVKEGSVFVSSQISKNRRDGKIKLPNKVIKLMIDLEVFNHHSGCYLFGKGFLPSEKRQDARFFSQEFGRVRDALGFPKNYLFYSLKDSGLRDIANTAGIEVAQKQARHSSIQTTNLYLKGKGMKVYDVLADFEGYL